MKKIYKSFPRVYINDKIIVSIGFLLISSITFSQEWKSEVKQFPNPEQVRFNINNEILNLNEHFDIIYDYYQHKPIDTFFIQSFASDFTNQKLKIGLRLRDSVIDFPNYDAYKLPNDSLWFQNPYNSGSWLWNLHQIKMIPALVAAHNATNDSWYLLEAQKYMHSWLKYNLGETFPSELSWGDHATAIRLYNICVLYEYSRDKKFSKEFLKTVLYYVYIHCNVLCDDDFFSKHHNHGFYQAFYLYLASCLFPEFEMADFWKKTGKNKTTEEIKFAFSDEGIHVENAPNYHLLLFKSVYSINEVFINYSNDLIFENSDSLLNSGLEFIAYILKPNTTFPLIGDCNQRTYKDKMEYKLNFYPQYLYSYTKGLSGIKPFEADKVWSNSGYAIFRDKWHEHEDFEETVYMVFKSGFLSSNHRHADDLSFILYAFGEDWIIDSGKKYNGINGNVFNYVISNRAHNLVMVDDLPAPIEKEYVGKSRIDSVLISDGFCFVEGSHNLINGFDISRKIEYLKPNNFIIQDQVISKNSKQHNYKVLFHIPNDKEIKIMEDSVVVCSKRNDNKLIIKPIDIKFNNIYLVSGQKKPYYQGFLSLGVNEIVNSNCLIFETNSISFTSRIDLTFD